VIPPLEPKRSTKRVALDAKENGLASRSSPSRKW
jgi:hypothetical protein